MVKILWNKKIQCGQNIQARSLPAAVLEKKNSITQGQKGTLEFEKLEKYLINCEKRGIKNLRELRS